MPDVDELFPSEPLEDDAPYVADDTFPNEVEMAPAPAPAPTDSTPDAMATKCLAEEDKARKEVELTIVGHVRRPSLHSTFCPPELAPAHRLQVCCYCHLGR